MDSERPGLGCGRDGFGLLLCWRSDSVRLSSVGQRTGIRVPRRQGRSRPGDSSDYATSGSGSVCGVPMLVQRGDEQLEEPSAIERVYAVVPVHNRVAFTRECLDSLVAQSYPGLSIVVVDDGSVDETSSIVRREYPEVVLLQGSGDMWWTGATNMGISWVLDRAGAGDWVLTLNNDTTVDDNYISTLVGLSASWAPAVVGSVVVDARDGDTVEDGGPVVRWATAKWGRLSARRSLRACREEGTIVTEPDFLAGRGTLIPVGCLRKVGLFDSRRLPHYYADYEFSSRAAKAGYRLVMSYEAPVYSHVDATGTTTRRGRLPWRDFAAMYFSRRSPACLLYRWRFARLAAPRWALIQFITLDTIRVVAGGLRDQMTSERADGT
jgi:GT2 family glycosyltransferase